MAAKEQPKSHTVSSKESRKTFTISGTLSPKYQNSAKTTAEMIQGYLSDEDVLFEITLKEVA